MDPSRSSPAFGARVRYQRPETSPRILRLIFAIEGKRQELRRRTRRTMKASKQETVSEQTAGEPASRLIDQRIRDLAGWRGETLTNMRALILEADPDVTEEWKWSNPIWSHHGIICTGEAYQKVVKLTFAKGASLPDPSHLFNSSLQGNTRRAIDIHESEKVDARAFKALVKAAVAQNGAPAKSTKVKLGPTSSKARARSAVPEA
jgi:hypothetical protein